MGIAISYISLPFIHLINKFTKLHESTNGNWITYLSLLNKLFLKRKYSKGKFELYNPDIEGDPHAIGLLPFNEEWIFECPNRNKAENLFVYGTNSWGQYLLVNIKCRPQKDSSIKASVNLIFKDENGLVYELNENDFLKIKSNATLKEYKIAGLTIEVLCPFRKLRIKVRAYLRRKDTNELIFAKFRLFWSSISNVFDFENDFNDQFIAKEFSALDISSVKLEERHEQWGQISGTIQFENEKIRELFLWGNKAKQYFSNNYKSRRITRVYGFDTKGFALHIGALTSEDNMRLRYGYMSFGTGCVYSMTSISLSFNQIETIGTSITKFTIDLKSENRTFDVEIEKSYDEYNGISICDMKLNGHKGKCVIVHETQEEAVVNSPLTSNPIEKVVSDLVLSISDERSQNVLCCGGKGASLGSLYQMTLDLDSNFLVPNGIIVTNNSYQTLLNDCPQLQNEIERLEKIVWSEMRETMRSYCENVSQMFEKQKLPQIIENEIKKNLKSIFGENFDSIHFAVRSSASGEDSDEMSAAGQMTTILGLKGIDEISSAVMKCWSSQFSYVSVEYKRGYGQEINSSMAVVIQEMINCDSAGVIFTCDPLTGDERKLIITANYGIGESVVSALSEPDTIRLNVNIEDNSLQKQRTIKNIESIEIGSKLKSITLKNNNESGTIEINTPQSDICCLSESECLILGNIALEVHKYYGNPRDIEWGIKDKKIYLLQSRPITNLDNSLTEWEVMHDIDSGQPSEREYYSRANLGEVFPGASSHMCLSWLVNCWNANGFRQWKQLFNLTNKEFSPYFNKGFGIVSNHNFFLLKTGNFPLVGDPKSTFSRSIQIGIFGHYFDDEEVFNDSNERAIKKISSTFVKIKGALNIIYYFLTPEIRLRKAKETLKNFNIFYGKNSYTAKDVFKVISETAHMNYEVSYAHGNVTMSSMIYNIVLLNMLKTNNQNEIDSSYTDFAQLFSSTNQVVSAEVPNSLRLIANHIENREQFRAMSDEKALKYLLNDESKASLLFKEFLLKYGHRGYKEFDPLYLQWADNPISVIKSLKTMLNGNELLKQTKEIKSIDEIISSLKTPLSFTKKLLLKYWIIPWCRSGVSLREEGKHLLTFTINEYRHAFWRLAKLMVSEGRLPETDLLFHMTFPELQTLIYERDPLILIRAKMRKRFHEQKEKLKFSETNIGPNIKPRNEIQSFTDSDGIINARIKGIPVSVGKIKARCCVAMTLDEAQNIQSGDILITYSTDIGWSPYFPMLSGLATEIGGLISHGAVIAREYGLPCLVGVEGASHLFKTGDTVILDSELAEIIKIN